MKLKSLISALVVFTIVMTCAVSAVSAMEAKYTTTTTYSAAGVTVTTEVTGLSEDSMVSYVIYDDSETDVPNDGNIKYINQDTASKGNVSFTITDTVAKLNGKKILMGSNLDTLVPKIPNDNRVDDIEDSSYLLVTYDGEVNKEDNSVTFLVHQNKADVQTGINVVATVGDEEYVFNNLVNLAVNDGLYDKYYAIQLVDKRTENPIDFSACTFKVTPVVNGIEMTNMSDSKYWIETVAGN